MIYVLGAVAIVVAVTIALGGSIDRERVQAFTSLHRLVLTPDNGPQVVRALATTHRWRRFGLATGLGLAAAASLTQNRIELNFVAMFVGWFVGAVVAEWRINTPPRAGQRRVAGLAPRTLASYVTASNRGALIAAVVVVVAAATVSGVLTFAHRVPAGGWLMAAGWCVGIVVILAVVTRRVLDRPRPSEPDDVREADDALRGHSLPVLTGSAIALAAWPLFDFIAIIAERLGAPEAAGLFGLMAMILALLGGWRVARSESARPPAVVEVAP